MDYLCAFFLEDDIKGTMFTFKRLKLEDLDTFKLNKISK